MKKNKNSEGVSAKCETNKINQFYGVNAKRKNTQILYIYKFQGVSSPLGREKNEK
jgi:hypothetical protein